MVLELKCAEPNRTYFNLGMYFLQHLFEYCANCNLIVRYKEVSMKYFQRYCGTMMVLFFALFVLHNPA